MRRGGDIVYKALLLIGLLLLLTVPAFAQDSDWRPSGSEGLEINCDTVHLLITAVGADDRVTLFQMSPVIMSRNSTGETLHVNAFVSRALYTLMLRNPRGTFSLGDVVRPLLAICGTPTAADPAQAEEVILSVNTPFIDSGMDCTYALALTPSATTDIRVFINGETTALTPLNSDGGIEAEPVEGADPAAESPHEWRAGSYFLDLTREGRTRRINWEVDSTGIHTLLVVCE